MTGPRSFALLNQEVSVESPERWNDPSRDKLLLYHLHYLDDLSAAGAAVRRDWHADIIDQWIADNPPLVGNGWEPYPLSLRIVNWIKWQLAGNALSESQLASLWIQARVLYQSIEYHLQANHLIANAKGLFFAGAFFAGGEADKWLRKATAILSREIGAQVLQDGGHIERSPMYQAVLLEDFLDIVNLARTCELGGPSGVVDAAKSMFRWLFNMTHPDGQPAYFNDTVAGNTVTLAQLQGYAERLGIDVRSKSVEGIHLMPDSGYARYRSGEFDIFMDFGNIGPDFQPGHAHCDTLSFELSRAGKHVFVNTGVSTYNDNARRHLERGTAAHNTVAVAGTEQSEIWGAFRVGRRARPVGIAFGEDFITAGHDGFRRAGMLHRRRFAFAAGELLIEDLLESPAPATGQARFHCYPDVRPIIGDGQCAVEDVVIAFANHDSIELEPYEYCLGFNRRTDATCIVVTFTSTLSTRITSEDPVH